MHGHTLVELTFVLLLLGVAAASVAPTARQARDRAAVASAREALVGLLVETRLAAIETGGASVMIQAAPARAEGSANGTTLRRLDLAADFGVRLALGAARPVVELRYDALGLGRVASQTIVLRRGSAAAQLVVSSYGRVRRR